MKPKLFLVPVYIGSLKYYLKILPALLPDYEVEFLLIRPPDERRRQMEDYFHNHGYPYRLIEAGLKEWKFRLPIFTPLIKHLVHLRACRKFFLETKPTKLILTKILPPHDLILKEANRLGIDTIVLQWAYAGARAVGKSNLKPLPWPYRFYYRTLDRLYGLLEYAWGGSKYTGIWGQANKVGIMDISAAPIFWHYYGIPSEKLTVVGMVDQELIQKLKLKLNTDRRLRKRLKRHYGLNSDREMVLILAWNFHKKRGAGFTLDEHLSYFAELIKLIKASWSKGPFALVLKLHPGDDPGLYHQLSLAEDVRVLGDEAETEELICLADLVVVDPWTAANVLVKASRTPAIFVNFSKLSAINAGRELYQLRGLARTREEFKDLLGQFQFGCLPWQYDPDPPAGFEVLDRIKALVKK